MFRFVDWNGVFGKRGCWDDGRGKREAARRVPVRFQSVLRVGVFLRLRYLVTRRFSRGGPQRWT